MYCSVAVERNVRSNTSYCIFFRPKLPTPTLAKHDLQYPVSIGSPLDSFLTVYHILCKMVDMALMSL